jgi:hypothetical protein
LKKHSKNWSEKSKTTKKPLKPEEKQEQVRENRLKQKKSRGKSKLPPLMGRPTPSPASGGSESLPQ